MDGSLRQGHAEYIVPPEDSGWTPGSTAAGEEKKISRVRTADIGGWGPIMEAVGLDLSLV